MRVVRFKAAAIVALWIVLTLIWIVSNQKDTSRRVQSVRQPLERTQHVFVLAEDDPDRLMGDRILAQLNYSPKEVKTSEIFLIYEFDEFPRSAYLRRIDDCHLRNCFFTNIETHVSSASALVLTPAFVERLPLERTRDQQWLLLLLESPEHTQSLVDFNGKINFTASYRWDSDLVTPYGKWLPSRPDTLQQHNLDIHKKKTKDVAWVATNCFTSNQRRAYATELAKYIKVDVFGECGSGRISDAARDKMLQEDYLFYLAFENSNCRDYVTEKLFANAFNNSVLPIVMGAFRSFYERIAPPGSFIHVDDFESPQLLAKYLKYLSRTPEAYNAYFAWRGSGRFIDNRFSCRVCALLQSGRSKVYQDVEKWWHGGQKSVGGGDCTTSFIALQVKEHRNQKRGTDASP